jgi:phosphohistidine phosphatase
MRHAKSSWRDPSLDDHERPLNGRGRRAAPQMGALLAALGLVPSRVYSSTATRAVETAREVLRASGFDGPLIITRRLYLAEPGTFYDLLTEVEPGTESVLFVAHNPGISELLAELTGEQRDMPTAALACVDVDVEELGQVTRSTRGALVGYHRPPRDEKDELAFGDETPEVGPTEAKAERGKASRGEKAKAEKPDKKRRK